MRAHLRAINKIKSAIKKLDLDLSGLNVLTEVGSNEFIYTPVIAAMAGAKKVFAWTRDSKYSLGDENISECKKVLAQADINCDIEFYNGSFNKEHLELADMITNSGFLRPLDENKLKYTKGGLVIPLMYEKWELRESDIDINYCKKKGIKVAGTWENHPDLMVFNHIGPLAIKMALNAGYEVYRNKIIVWSDDHFGEVASKAFRDFGALEVIQTTDENILYMNITDVDFIFICDYSEPREYYGKEGFFDIDKFLVINKILGLIHLYGRLDFRKIQGKVSLIYPEFDGRASTMSFTLSHVGLNPIINLQAAGFKVGQLLMENKESELVQII